MAMKTRTFANGPDSVGNIGFGAMGLAGMTQEPKSQEIVDGLLQKCIDEGVTVLDTSDIYAPLANFSLGFNERQIGSFFERNPGSREKFFLCTKFAIADVNRTVDNSAEYCHKAVEASLKNLQTDHIDLYYVHRYDGSTDPAVTAKAMKELKDAGKIKYVGVSEFPPEKLARFNEFCHVDAIQNELSPWTPEPLTNGTLDWCEKNKTMFVAFSPLGVGFLTGTVRKRSDLAPTDLRLFYPRFSEENFDKNLELVDKFKAIADRKGATSGQVTLAWLLAKSPFILPIPGTSQVANLEQNCGADRVELTEADKKEIDDVLASFNVSGTRLPEFMLKNLSH